LDSTRPRTAQIPRTILDELKRIQSTDVVLPTEDGRELRLRGVVRPDAAQAALLDASGSTYRNASACRHRPPRTPKCSGDFFAKYPKLRL
jgi:hypothetical protein